jgi:hypothetical protein
MFRVEWEPAASDRFAVISMNHTNRWKDINAADNDIARRLEQDPVQHSTPISERLRRITSDPLAIYFCIEDDLVIVESVRWVGSK